MTAFIASIFVEDGTLQLSLNGKVILRGRGQCRKELQPGTTYKVAWQVQGKPGSAYTLSISSPREAEMQLTKTIGKSGEDASEFEFEM
ncbi:hypothetical protein AB9P05_22170 [Roseivirga sp. BDSF3-8]|uniref:hypothetical protein n=1 Tax=Roseivirga sp. BDSF3-8 TaxID=3241598 RepID=UPI003531C341